MDMKCSFLVGALAFAPFANTVFAQDIPQSQVPSVIVNRFQQTFPKAHDVEWEIKGDQYKVEFETGLLGTDHDVWFDKAGKLVKHKQDISKTDLPPKVRARINADFKSYRIDDVNKITEGGKEVYTLELEHAGEEGKVAVDANGTVLSKVSN